MQNVARLGIEAEIARVDRYCRHCGAAFYGLMLWGSWITSPDRSRVMGIVGV
jgi:hypothetical protein